MKYDVMMKDGCDEDDDKSDVKYKNMVMITDLNG
jgi:hypothetical protein